MADFGRSKGRRGRDSRDSRGGSRDRRDSRDDFRGRSSFGGDRRGRDFRRGRDKPEMTRVVCSECGVECEVPFRPSSDKPVYCNDCFSKKGKGGSDKSNQNFEILNAKLDKIMKALEID